MKTHEVYDRINKKIVYSGSFTACNNWTSKQPIWHDYYIKPITTSTTNQQTTLRAIAIILIGYFIWWIVNKIPTLLVIIICVTCLYVLVYIILDKINHL